MSLATGAEKRKAMAGMVLPKDCVKRPPNWPKSETGAIAKRIDHDGMPVWTEDAKGRAMCGALNELNEPCRRMGAYLDRMTGRCRFHPPGRDKIRGITHTEKGRVQQMERVIASVTEEALFDPAILSHASNIATMEALVQRRIELVSEPVVGEWDKARRLASKLKGKDGKIDVKAYGELIEVLERGGDQHGVHASLMRELAPMLKLLESAKKAEELRLTREENTLTKRDALIWIRAIVQVANETIPDPDIRKKFAERLAVRTKPYIG
jgi:hypothetical protein